jgi:hypothetical protein
MCSPDSVNDSPLEQGESLGTTKLLLLPPKWRQSLCHPGLGTSSADCDLPIKLGEFLPTNERLRLGELSGLLRRLEFLLSFNDGLVLGESTALKMKGSCVRECDLGVFGSLLSDE